MKKQQIAQGYILRAYEALGYDPEDASSWKQKANIVKNLATDDCDGEEFDELPCPELEGERQFHVGSYTRKRIQESSSKDISELTDDELDFIMKKVAEAALDDYLMDYVDTVTNWHFPGLNVYISDDEE